MWRRKLTYESDLSGESTERLFREYAKTEQSLHFLLAHKQAEEANTSGEPIPVYESQMLRFFADMPLRMEIKHELERRGFTIPRAEVEVALDRYDS